MRGLSPLASPTALLYTLVIVTQFAAGVYFASGLEPPALFTSVLFLGLLWIVGWWLRTDSRKRGIAWVYDMGFFLYIAWPFIMPWYLYRSRGPKGLLVVLAFIGTYVGAAVLGLLLYLFLAPEGWPMII